MGFLDRIFKSKKKDKHIDVYIVSYPKTGRTWLRFMLCNYIECKYNIKSDKDLGVYQLTQSAHLKTTEFTHDQAHMVDKEPYYNLEFCVPKYQGKSVVLLGRDFKDTLVSAYHQATKRNVVFEGTLSDFVRDDRFGVKKLARFYDMWIENIAVVGRCMYLSYEDMHKDPAGSLTAVLAFIGEKTVDDSALQNAIKSGSFENMRAIEENLSVGSSILQPGDLNDQNSFKTRKGIVGSYVDELSVEDIRYIDEQMAGIDLGRLQGKRDL